MLGDFAGEWPRRLTGQLDRVTFRPDSLGADAVTALALVPPIVTGLVLFRLPALQMLAVAVGVGSLVHLFARLFRQPLLTSPVLPAIIGVALCGPRSPLIWPLAIAALASALELVRGRLPRAGIQTGVLSYSILFLASGGAMATYLKPAGMVRFPEPIQQWSRFYGGASHFIEPSTLYVGNVAGPVFATSVLAVAISLAWLWYARRLSLTVVLTFLIGGTTISLLQHWDPVFQLDSGPAWFVVGIALADRRLLPNEGIGRGLLGLGAGVIGIGIRAGNFYVEGLFLAVAALQLVYAAAAGGIRFAVPRLRSRADRHPQAQKEPASA